MEKIRVAIIGTGAISHRHMKVWSNIPLVEIVAAAEIDEPRLKKWGEQYKIADLYTDFREMLKRDDINAVDVCVHNNLHAPIAIAVMKAGKNCYSEKPMSASYYDSKLMYDCAKATGMKFATQISSIFTEQARVGRELIAKGILGDVYHARSAFASYRRRPSLDLPKYSPDFMNKELAGYGQLIDLGIYHLGCMLFMLGLPELKSVFGKIYYKMANPVPSRELGVEDMGVGFAEFKGGLTLEIQESNASNMADVGKGYISGTLGSLQYKSVDAVGGDWSVGLGPEQLIAADRAPDLRFVGEYKGMHVDCDLKPYYNQSLKKVYDPSMMMWYDNQLHWYSYLTGILTDETRYNTPFIGMQVSLLTDGIVISNQEGRSVTVDEIKEKSKSLAVWHQKTPWGVFDYDSTF